MPLHNPYKPGTQCHALLEAFRANGYRLRKSWMVQPERMKLFIQSPQTRESDMRKDGFVIDPVKPDHLEGNVNDLWHVMKYDPFNPEHADRAPVDGKITEPPEKLPGPSKIDKIEPAERPEFGWDFCEKHKARYKFGEGCWRCAGERLKA